MFSAGSLGGSGLSGSVGYEAGGREIKGGRPWFRKATRQSPIHEKFVWGLISIDNHSTYQSHPFCNPAMLLTPFDLGGGGRIHVFFEHAFEQNKCKINALCCAHQTPLDSIGIQDQ